MHITIGNILLPAHCYVSFNKKVELNTNVDK